MPNNVGSASEWHAGAPGPIEGAHNVVTKGVDTGPRGRLFYGYQATNKCCRDWLLLGWPSRLDGRPKHLDATRDPVMGITCPQCGGMIYFDLAHWDTVTEMDNPDDQQGAVIVGGRFRVSA